MYCNSLSLFVILLHLQKTKLTSSCTDTELVTVEPNNWYYTQLNQNHALQGHVIATIQTRNSAQCGTKCGQNKDCKSFNYSTTAKTCELNDATHLTHSTDLVAKTGFQNFMYDWSKFSGCSFTTPNNYCFQFMFPRLPDGVTRIEFSVRTSADAELALTTENRLTNPCYEIVIGGGGGTVIFIRRSKNGGNELQKNFAAGELIVGTEYRRFWIDFADGHIQIGRHGEAASIADWQDPNPLPVRYIGFASYVGVTSDWKLHTFCDTPPA